MLHDDVYLVLKETKEADYMRLAGTETTRLWKKGVSKEIEFDEFKMILYVREADSSISSVEASWENVKRCGLRAAEIS